MISESKIVVRYQETDQMGIVHHSVYPIWYEVARTDFCAKMGLRYSEMEAMGIMTPLYEVHSYYKMPAKFEDVLTVTAQVCNVSAYRLEFLYIIRKENQVIHTGKTIHVWVDAQKFKPLNMKKHFPNVLDMVEKTIEKEPLI